MGNISCQSLIALKRRNSVQTPQKNPKSESLYSSNRDDYPMKAASFEYIEVFYNRTRQHVTLGYRSPVQYLEEWMKRQNQENLAA
jgi:transposase InsO family protein